MPHAVTPSFHHCHCLCHHHSSSTITFSLSPLFFLFFVSPQRFPSQALIPHFSTSHSAPPGILGLRWMFHNAIEQYRGWSWDYESSYIFTGSWSRTMECCVLMLMHMIYDLWRTTGRVRFLVLGFGMGNLDGWNGDYSVHLLSAENFMTGYRVVFDREKLTLGWKKFDCYDIDDHNAVPTRPHSDNVPPAVGRPWSLPCH